MAAALQRLAREVDLIHVTGARGLVAAGIARTGKKLVWPARVAARDKLDPVLERIPDLIIANSHATAARFSADSRVEVIPNGVRQPVRAAEHLSLTAGLRHIAIIARMTPEKGHEDLLPVIEDLLANHADCEVVTLGDDSGRIGDDWRELAARHPRLKILGPVKQAADHLFEFDLVVIPSRVEGFGRVAAEAMMAGVPVLARRVGGLIETLANAPDCFLPDDRASWKECILRALDNPPPVELLTRAGSAFTVERHVKGVIRAYEELLS
jgi:glycosyltransferase involved in cell wall biosynthesis